MIELTDELMQEVELVLQGIPALYEFSEHFASDHGRVKELVNAFFNLTARHRGRFLDVRLAPLIFVLVYLFEVCKYVEVPTAIGEAWFGPQGASIRCMLRGIRR